MKRVKGKVTITQLTYDKHLDDRDLAARLPGVYEVEVDMPDDQEADVGRTPEETAILSEFWLTKTIPRYFDDFAVKVEVLK